MRALLLAAVLCSAGAARGQEAQPALTWQGRLSVGPLYDSNPAREIESPDPEASGGFSGVTSLDAAWRPGAAHLTTLSFDGGIRLFAAAEDENQLAGRLSLAHAIRATDWLAPVLSVSGKDRQIRDPEQPESSELEATLGAELGPWGFFSPRVYGGARRFSLRPERSFSYDGPLGGVLLRALIPARHVFALGWELSGRNFHDGISRPPAHLLSADWSYRGRFLLGGGYQLTVAPEDKILGRLSHRAQALAGMRVPGELLLSLEATYLYARPRVSTQDEDLYSTLGAKVTRIIANPFAVEGTVRLYHSFLGGDYDRVVLVIGLSLAI